jgi:hypothetical protein
VEKKENEKRGRKFVGLKHACKGIVFFTLKLADLK